MSNALTHKLWLAQLKRHIPEPLRMDALKLLYYLSSQAINRQIAIEDIGSMVKKEDVDNLLSSLISTGVIEEGFTSIRLTDDDIFIDFIKRLYKMEVLRESQEEMVKMGGEVKRESLKDGFLEVNLPSMDYSGGIAIGILEEVSKAFGIPSDTIGRLQVAIAEAMNTLPIQKGCRIGFKMGDDDFLIRIEIPSEVPLVEDDVSLRLIKGIVDDVRIERLPGSSRLTISKKIYRPSQPALQ
ncbi:MAG: hypothetical protein Fur0020_04240 [Thermodesulfovibrionia bacterium]